MSPKVLETYIVLAVMLLSVVMATRAHVRSKKEVPSERKKEEAVLSEEELAEEKEVNDAVRAACKDGIPFWEGYVLQKRAEPVRERNRQRIVELESEINRTLRRDVPGMLWTLLFCGCIFYSFFRGLL